MNAYLSTLFKGPNGRELATFMCTPRDLTELALGFLYNEGVIDGLIAGPYVGVFSELTSSSGRVIEGFSSEIGHVRRLPGGAQCRCGQRGCIEAVAAHHAHGQQRHELDDHEDREER